MSTLPQKIPDADIPFGTANQDGTVTISTDWYLALIAISNKVLGNGTSPTAELHYEFMNSADAEMLGLDAYALGSAGSRNVPFDASPIGVSPVSATAPARGMFQIVSGTFTGVFQITRGSGSYALPTSVVLIPVSLGDVLTMSYTVAPHVTFIPL